MPWMARRTWTSSTASLFLALTLLTHPTHTQSPHSESAQDRDLLFQAGIDLVTLNVVVTDGRQQLLTGLTPESFEVFEDGTPQTITFFASGAVPVDVALLVDTSASMFGRMDALHQAAIRFLDVLRPGDRVIVVDVGNRVRVLHPLSRDFGSAAEAIRRTVAMGNTTLYNALYTTMKELRRLADPEDVRRQVITIFSDGEDTASIVSYDDVFEEARRAGIVIYPMLLQPSESMGLEYGRSVRARFALKELAKETGGLAFFPPTMTQVPEVYRAIGQDMLGQYALGYVSTNRVQDGAYRRLQVRVKGVKASSRTRLGYYAGLSPR